jgi:hypothetical protein
VTIRRNRVLGGGILGRGIPDTHCGSRIGASEFFIEDRATARQR